MKHLFSVLALVAALVYPAVPTLAITIDEDTQDQIEDRVNDAKDATFDARQEGILTALNQAEQILDDAESQLQSSTYASEKTKEDGQALIDDAQEELADIQADVEDADDSDELEAARVEAVEWLQDNKDVAKELAVDLYIDSLNVAVDEDEQIIKASKSLVPYFQLYNLDTTEYKQLIDVAEDSLATAKTDVAEAEDTRTQDSLENATRSSAQMVEDTAKLLEEADSLYAQMTE